MLNNLLYEFHGKQNRSPTVIGSGFFLQFISAITPVKYMYQWNIEIAERRITQVSKYIPKVASYVFELSWLTSVVINSSLRWSSGVFFLVCFLGIFFKPLQLWGKDFYVLDTVWKWFKICHVRSSPSVLIMQNFLSPLFVFFWQSIIYLKHSQGLLQVHD